MKPEPANLRAAYAQAGSVRGAAALLGIPESTLRGHMRRDPELRLAAQPAQAAEREPAGTTLHADGSVTVVSRASENLGDVSDLLLDAGLDPADWVVLTATISRWEALAHGGGEDGEPRVVTLRQRKVTFRRKADLALLSPAVHAPKVKRGKLPRKPSDRSELIVVEGDHQAPYHDPDLHAASVAALRDMRPVAHVFLGDTIDLPTVSRHADHPAAMATPQECVQAGYEILRDKAEAAPNARRVKLKGNHDWRIESEVLSRAERLYGLSPADDGTEQEHIFSVRRLLHLDALGVELVEHRLGWQHAEVELVPGPEGLVVRHGFATGHNTAGRTLAKLGRSVIVGHDHTKATAYRLDPVMYGQHRPLRVAAVAGTMSLVGGAFPHFTVNPDWHPGFVTVERWPDGRFVVEHAVWQAGSLFWRDKRWTP